MKWCILWELDVISHAFSNVGMKHDAIQQPTTFSHQKPTTKPSRLFHRFQDTFPDSTKKEKHKLKETPPPFLKIVSGFRVTHIKKTHLDVLQKNLFQPDCHWGSGQTAAFFECKWSSSSSHTDRMIPERQNCGRKPTKNQGEAYCLPKFGRFFRKKNTNFWEIYISSQVAIVIHKAQVHQNSSLPVSCIFGSNSNM